MTCLALWVVGALAALCKHPPSQTQPSAQDPITPAPGARPHYIHLNVKQTHSGLSSGMSRASWRGEDGPCGTREASWGLIVSCFASWCLKVLEKGQMSCQRKLHPAPSKQEAGGNCLLIDACSQSWATKIDGILTMPGFTRAGQPSRSTASKKGVRCPD